MNVLDVFVRPVRPLPWGRYDLRCHAALSEYISSLRGLNSWLLFCGSRPRVRLTAALLMWSAAFFVPSLALSWNTKTASIRHVLFVLVCMVLGFSCVQLAYERLEFYRTAVVRLLPDQDSCHEIGDFLRCVFSCKWQRTFAVASSVWSWWLAWCYLPIPSSPVSIWLYVWWSFAIGVLIGNGVYWALITPEFVRRMVRSPAIVLDPTAPAHTPGLRALSSILGTCAVMNAIGFTAIVVGFQSMPAGHPEYRRWILLGHIAAGLVVVAYSFIFPQLTLARAVWRQKAAAQLELITRLRGLDAESRPEDIEDLREQLDRVRASPSTPIAAAVLWDYATSIAVPIIAYVFGHREGIRTVARVLGF